MVQLNSCTKQDTQVHGGLSMFHMPALWEPEASAPAGHSSYTQPLSFKSTVSFIAAIRMGLAASVWRWDTRVNGCEGIVSGAASGESKETGKKKKHELLKSGWSPISYMSWSPLTSQPLRRPGMCLLRWSVFGLNHTYLARLKVGWKVTYPLAFSNGVAMPAKGEFSEGAGESCHSQFSRSPWNVWSCPPTPATKSMYYWKGNSASWSCCSLCLRTLSPFATVLESWAQEEESRQHTLLSLKWINGFFFFPWE